MTDSSISHLPTDSGRTFDAPGAVPRWQPPQRERWPAWVLSLGLHATLVAAMLGVIRLVPTGIATEPERTTGIALVRQEDGKREYFAEPEAMAASRQSQSGKPGVASSFPDASEISEMTVDVSSYLPGQDAPGAGGPAAAAAPRAGELGGQAAAGFEADGKTRTGVFGVYGEGTRFVYVFDRSGSMAGFEGRPLAAAKSELRASLNDLGRQNQFQIIFYNEHPRAFQPFGEKPKLQWGDQASKDLARAFVNEVAASGSTQHMEALQLALGLSPDVIFFLTDADEPVLSNADLVRIRRANKGTAIYAVEFGFGPQRNPDNFLVQMAQQNRGKHVYVDISRLPGIGASSRQR